MQQLVFEDTNVPNDVAASFKLAITNYNNFKSYWKRNFVRLTLASAYVAIFYTFIVIVKLNMNWVNGKQCIPMYFIC